jgi:hypothetical protein
MAIPTIQPTTALAASDHMKLFGSSHSGGTYQFVLCDGSVQR